MFMKHLEEQRIPTREPARTPPRRSGMWTRLSALALLTLGAGAVLSWFFPPQSTDDVSSEERQTRQEAFLQMDHFKLAPIPAQQVDDQIKEMRLPPIEREALRQQLTSDGARAASTASSSAPQQQNAKLSLARVIVWDTHSQDGDVITVSSAGYQVQVLLTNAMQAVTIPSDGVSPVQFTGTKDGGGGITLGIRGAQGEFLMPILAEGQSLALPVSF